MTFGVLNMIKISILIFSFCLLSGGLSANSEINKVLDTFHQAAANADQPLYFSLLDEQAVFLGTDGKERWTKKQFADFVTPYFSKGRGWLYKSTQRNITLVQQEQNGDQIAFFDELLNNSNYGQCRGSGLLRLTAQGWKILQYNLSIPVPNAISNSVVEDIKAYQHPLLSH
jgi:hypothetical protein